MRPQNWDKYEAALLLEACIGIQSGKVDKTEATAQLSASLRQKAINNGVEIDHVYRNTNGIQWQLSFMKKALEADKYDTRTPTQLFTDTVKLYQTDRKQFDEILAMAKKMCKKEEVTVREYSFPKTRKDAFEEWYSSENRKYPLSYVLEVFEETFRYSNEKKETTCIWDFTNLKAYNRRHNEITAKKLFRIIHRTTFNSFEKTWKIYAEFLKEYELQHAGGLASLPIMATNEECPETHSESMGSERIVEETELESVIVEEQLEEKHRILSSDAVLNYFGTLKDEYTDLEFTNIDAKGVTQRRCTYIFRKDIARNGHVLLEIWMNRGAELFTIWVKRALLTEEENKEIEQNDSGASLTRGKMERHFVYTEELLSFVKEKLERVNDVDVHDLLKRPRKSRECVKPEESEIDTTLKNQIVFLLKSHYAYGLRYDSPREQSRLRSFAETENIALPESDDKLQKALLACGNVIDGKLYAKDESMQESLTQLVQSIVDEGNSVIYYETLLEKHATFMNDHHIVSEEMLKDLLKKAVGGFCFAGKYMNAGDRSTEIELVGNEMRRIWGAEAVLAYSTISERLPYIPEAILQRVLSFNSAFLWNAEGEYLLIDRFVISQEEKSAIIDYVTAECEKFGFATLPEVPMNNLDVENYQVSFAGMQTAIYKVVLEANYSLNGKVLTKIGSPQLDADTIVKAAFRGRDKVTFDEVLEKVNDVVGEAHRHIAFRVLYEDFVRIDKTTFVARQHLRFDVDEIDRLLSEMLPDGFGAVKAITTYAMFPMCGYMWNAYVLESYCYLFSKVFSLHVVNFNDKNAGIIAKKDLNKDYSDLLALALVKANIALDETHALDYLCDNGYLAKRAYARIKDVLQIAEENRGAK